MVLEQHGLTGLGTAESREALSRLAREGKLEAYEIRVLELGGYLT